MPDKMPDRMSEVIPEVCYLATLLKHIREEVCQKSVVNFGVETQMPRSTINDAENPRAARDRTLGLQQQYVEAFRKLNVPEEEIARVEQAFKEARRAVRARRAGQPASGDLAAAWMNAMGPWLRDARHSMASAARWSTGSSLRLAGAVSVAALLLALIVLAVVHLSAPTPTSRPGVVTSATPTSFDGWIAHTVPWGTGGDETGIAFDNPATGGYEEPLDPDLGNGYDSYLSPVLSPDGKTLAYTARKIGGGYDIWIARVVIAGAKTPPIVDRKHRVLPDCGEACTRLHWSSDGAYILFAGPGGKTTALNPLTGRTHPVLSS